MIRNQEDTIAAVATPLSSAGIGIIRISGPKAFTVADRVFQEAGQKAPLLEAPTHTIHYGHIVEDGRIIDEVLVMVMRAPRSYTTEDTVEINCHGGVLVLRKVLDLVLRNGARTAEPGEFTRRAFLNGRIDLAQAESVMDLIESKNEYAMRGSINTLKGKFSEKIRSLRSEILYQNAYLEAALDDPEHISLDGFSEKLITEDEKWITTLSSLISQFHNGRILREGIRTVILGRPNVGKSSLMNLLMGEERAIVTNVAGTTRDTLEEYLTINEMGLTLVDTAGIRETEDVVEKIGVERARQNAEAADLILYVVDGSENLQEEDYEIMELIRTRKAIVILNKNDLDMQMLPRELEFLVQKKVIPFSAKSGEGLNELKTEIQKMFYEGRLTMNDELFMENARQKESLEKAKSSLTMVKNNLLDGMPEDLVSIDLTDAYEELGKVIGESVDEDLINEIFGRFCMGK